MWCRDVAWHVDIATYIYFVHLLAPLPITYPSDPDYTSFSSTYSFKNTVGELYCDVMQRLSQEAGEHRHGHKDGKPVRMID